MTAQTLGTAVPCTQARKAQEGKDVESAKTKTRLQIQWSSIKSVCCASACLVVQLHDAHLYVPTFFLSAILCKGWHAPGDLVLILQGVPHGS